MPTNKPASNRAPRKQPKQPEPKTFPVQIILGMILDGQHVGNLAQDGIAEAPPEGGTLQLHWPVDVRELAAVCEQILGPRQQASKLWTPNGDKPVRIVN